MKKLITFCFLFLIIPMFSVCYAKGAEPYDLPGQKE